MNVKISPRMMHYAKTYYDAYKESFENLHPGDDKFLPSFQELTARYNEKAAALQGKAPLPEEGSADYQSFEIDVGKIMALAFTVMKLNPTDKNFLKSLGALNLQVPISEIFGQLGIDQEQVKRAFAAVEPILRDAGILSDSTKEEITEDEHDDLLFDDEDDLSPDTEEFDENAEKLFEERQKKGIVDEPYQGGISEQAEIHSLVEAEFGKNTEKTANVKLGEDKFISAHHFALDGKDPEKDEMRTQLNMVANVLGGRDVEKELYQDLNDRLKAADEAVKNAGTGEFGDLTEGKALQNRHDFLKGSYPVARGRWESRTFGDILRHPIRSWREYSCFKNMEKELSACKGETKEGMENLYREANNLYDFSKNVPAVNEAQLDNMLKMDELSKLDKTDVNLDDEKLLRDSLNAEFGRRAENPNLTSQKKNEPSIENPTVERQVGK